MPIKRRRTDTFLSSKSKNMAKGILKSCKAKKVPQKGLLKDEVKFSAENNGSGKLSEEDIDHDLDAKNDEDPNRESTMYDQLLKKLGKHNRPVSIALKRRQQEEQGKSATDEDEGSSQYLSESEENDDGDVVFSKNHEFRVSSKDSVQPEEVEGDDDDDIFSETDEENLVEDDATPSGDSFHNHLCHKLSPAEVNALLERKWKYTWKIPALNLANCYWRGTGKCFMEGWNVDSFDGIKPKLYQHFLESSKASGSSELHKSARLPFLSLCNSYYDIMHHNKKPFYLKGMEEDSSVLDAYLLHCLNHILKSKDLVAKNEKQLVRNESLLESNCSVGDMHLDRGFTRPKVLILLPLAGIARRTVTRLIKLTPLKHRVNVDNLEHFYKEFGSGKTEAQEESDDAEISKIKKATKPPDFEALLGEENDNDHFVMGIKFTNRDLKLYADFYTSDLIVASPLGLITKIGEAEMDKGKDVDYLSSIEILIIDHADIMLMQNWSHVVTVVEHLNRLPSNQHGTDIMRIRPWFLDDHARFYRQSIILSSHIHPELNAMFNRLCINHQGKVKLECTYKGVLRKVLSQARQIYERFDTDSIIEADDARLKYFCEKVFPAINGSSQGGVMIFASSYFEYVRLRNYLKSQAASFCLFGEYIQRDDISHVRGKFFRGEKKMMLYTERAHFYYRYKIRGVKNLVIYSLPERKEFYPEIVNFLEGSDSMNCRVLFSRLDHFRLERIVGSGAAKRMINSDKGVFVFA